MASIETVSQVFKMLSRTYVDYSSKNLSGAGLTETIKVYHRILEDIPDALLQAACIDHMASSQWWPKPSELRERAKRIELSNIKTLTSIEAWAKAKKAALDHSFSTGDDVIDRVMTALGWKEFGQSQVTEEMSWRARFIASYEQALEQEFERKKEHPMISATRQNLLGDGHED